MAKQDVTLVSDQSDKMKTAQEAINDNFTEVYANVDGKITGDGVTKITVRASAPSSPSTGDIWIQST